jgi:uncharacterized protein (TIGR02757 family)
LISSRQLDSKSTLVQEKLIEFLNAKVEAYNQPSFVKEDPVSIPHLFAKKQDIEIAGFFAAVFSWGKRSTIIDKSKELMRRMDNAPYDFIINANHKELKGLEGFKHRTFRDDDLYYFIEFLKHHYGKNNSLESAFTKSLKQNDRTIENGLIGFKKYFFSEEHLRRTEKHISSPEQNSTCKRLNMFLRWMVRKDNKGVDFGIWNSISPSQLVCPVDVHVARVAKRFELLKRKQVDWQAALELTEQLRKLDPKDPVKFDFALFGLGIMEKF